MPLLTILTEPKQILRTRASEVKNPTGQEIKKLIPRMVKAMLAAGGVGLAAPQIGESIRLIIVNTKDGPLSCINPVIVKKSWFSEWGEEGCLSVPGTYGMVKRSKKVTTTFLDQYGKQVSLSASGLLARIFQHEIDHINGILFIDKAKDINHHQ